MGDWQSSSNSSNFPSGKSHPLNHMWPPSCQAPPVSTMHCQLHSCKWLYCLRKVRGIQKKMWLSTHFESGPIPLVRKMSAPALATCPKLPELEAQPKHALVLTANKLSSRCTMRLGH